VSAKRLAWAARRITKRAGGSIDVAIVLGSGLAGAVLARVAGGDIAYRKLGAPRATVPGHAGIARIGMWEGRRVVAFAGRAHLYEGYSPRDVTYLVRLAAASGATTIVLTNAAGGLSGAYVAGDVMVVADHINLTGTSPISRDEREPFVAMHDAYAPRLRKLARASGAQREGVYAGVRGPQYETRTKHTELNRATPRKKPIRQKRNDFSQNHRLSRTAVSEIPLFSGGKHCCNLCEVRLIPFAEPCLRYNPTKS